MQTSSKVYKDNWLDLQKGNILLISTIKPICKHHQHHQHHHDCVPVKPCPPTHHEHYVPCNPCETCHPHHHHPLPPKEPIDIDGDGWTEDIILFGKSTPTPKISEESVVMISDEDVDIESFEQLDGIEEESPIMEESTDLICEVPAIEENIWSETTSAEEIVEEKLETIKPVEEAVETPKRRINRGGRRKATK